MARLNHRAFEILIKELQHCAGDDPFNRVQKDIVLRRWERLQSQAGSPPTVEELRETVIDFFPTFSDKALKASVKANQPPGKLSAIVWVAGIAITSVGLVWVANLPYPMIRLPIAKTMPIILLPSYISMDRNYREAIAAVAQADQLVNKATSPADFDLGGQKVQQAQKNLDALPVWFLGYYPQFYCNLFRCSWYFTLDEFQTARANVATMEVKIFQEKNAQTGLDLAEQAIATAKQQYQQATSNADKDKARDAWQEAIAQLKQVPLETRSGKTAKTKLSDYQQDFEQVAGGTLISAAQQFAKQAEQDARNPPHTATEWQQVANLWEESIKLLKQVPLKDPGYLAAQKSLAESQSKLGIVQTRMQVEKESLDALEQAEKKIEYLLRRLPATPNSQDLGQIASELRAITYQLQKVKKETTAYPQAQELIQSAENKLKQLQPKK